LFHFVSHSWLREQLFIVIETRNSAICVSFCLILSHQFQWNRIDAVVSVPFRCQRNYREKCRRIIIPYICSIIKRLLYQGSVSSQMMEFPTVIPSRSEESKAYALHNLDSDASV
jgi:hypothetical protein